MNLKPICGIIAALGFAATAYAQRVGWEADFKTRFDNREFTGSSCNESQTIFLADLATAFTYNWMQKNTVRFGIEVQKDFGDVRGFFSEVRPLVSYAYRGGDVGADVGIFSRDELTGDYSRAFFNDSLKTYQPTVQGMALHYRNIRRGLQAEMALDWEGMYSEYSREKFRIFGWIDKGWQRRPTADRYYVGCALSVFHFANSALTQGNVVDNLLANPYVGIRRAATVATRRNRKIRIRHRLGYDIRAGFLWAPQRDRIADEGWKAPKGGELRIGLEWKGIQFENNLYAGENLMPLFDRYGGELYAGERWYGTPHKLYNRTRLGYERLFFNRTVGIKAGMIFHHDGDGLYTQQVLQVSVRLRETLYDARKHRRR